MTKILLHPRAFRTRRDEDLVALVRAGDDSAFDVIIDRYEAVLLAYAGRLLGGAHHDAEECVQDTFIRALGSLRGSDREMLLKPWLYTIVRNCCMDRLRKPSRNVDLSLLERVLHDGNVADPHAAAVRSDELRAMVAGVKRLPARQRTALVMHELGGRPHTEIARRLGVSTGGSKALVCRARVALNSERAAA